MKILVYGASTFGRVLRVLVEDCGHEFAGFIDDASSSEDVIGTFDATVTRYSPSEYAIVNAVGYSDLGARRDVTRRILDAGFAMPCLVHPKAIVGTHSVVGDGSVVMAGAVIDCNVTLGNQTVVWPSATVSHDSVLGENTFLSPNCTVCGGCTIGSDCFVGAGAVIVDRASVPDRSFVKAGALFTGR